MKSGPLSPVPQIPTPGSEWSGYIPFDELPQIFDPPSGVVATANARTTPDDYPYPITLNWAAPYRNERIWHLLIRSKGLTSADMLRIQTDIDSDFDRVLAQRLTYAIDHSLDHALADSPSAQQQPRNPAQAKQLQQAADILRTFDGRVTTSSSAAAILAATHAILWPMLLESQLQHVSPQQINTMYLWGERDYALEQILTHTPARWLPANYANWNDLLAAAVARALQLSHAPADLTTWHYGTLSTVDIEHAIFEQSPLLQRLLGVPTGTGSQPQSGDATTIKQVGHTFGPSERFTADLSNLNQSTLNLASGQSGNPFSPYFLDQFPAWLHGQTFPLTQPPTHTLTLKPVGSE